MVDPRLVLMLAAGTLLLLNGLIAGREERSTFDADAPRPDDPGSRKA